MMWVQRCQSELDSTSVPFHRCRRNRTIEVNAVEGMLSGCWRRCSQLCERRCSTPAAWTALCCLPRVAPMLSAASLPLGLAGFRCGISDAFCRLPCLHRPPMLALTCFFFQCVLLYLCCTVIPQSLSAVVAGRFGCFTTSTEGRLIAPRCRRQILSLVTNLPLFLLCFYPLLEARRSYPVHLSYFLYFV